MDSSLPPWDSDLIDQHEVSHPYFTKVPWGIPICSWDEQPLTSRDMETELCFWKDQAKGTQKDTKSPSDHVDACALEL